MNFSKSIPRVKIEERAKPTFQRSRSASIDELTSASEATTSYSSPDSKKLNYVAKTGNMVLPISENQTILPPPQLKRPCKFFIY